MYSLISYNHHPSTRLREFFKFCYFVSRKTFFKGIYALFLSVYQKEWLFSSFQCVLFFYYVAAINSLLGTLIQFSTFYSSRLPFRLVFNNLSKKFDDFFSALWCSCNIKSTVYCSSPGYWNLSQIHSPTPTIILTPCFLIFKREFSAHEFSIKRVR